MRIRIRIDFILSIPKLKEFFDFNPTAANTTLQPKVTIERLTKGYEEK